MGYGKENTGSRTNTEPGSGQIAAHTPGSVKSIVDKEKRKHPIKSPVINENNLTSGVVYAHVFPPISVAHLGLFLPPH